MRIVAFFFFILNIFNCNGFIKKEGYINDFTKTFNSIEQQQLESVYKQKLSKLPSQFYWIFISSTKRKSKEDWIDLVDDKWNNQQLPIGYILVIQKDKTVFIQERHVDRPILSKQEKDFIQHEILEKHFQYNLFYRGTKISMDAIESISNKSFTEDDFIKDLEMYLDNSKMSIKDNKTIKHGLFILVFVVVGIIYFGIYQENYIRRMIRDFIFGKEEIQMIQKILPFKDKLASFKNRW